MNLLEQVQGHAVRLVAFNEEAVTLTFDAYTLVVYNAYYFAPWEAIGQVPAATVDRVAETAHELTFRFSTGVALIVKMDDDGYNGPESVILYGEKGECLVVCN